jgi:hypothetical protein
VLNSASLNLRYWDKTAPATGTNDVIITLTNPGIILVGVQSATGVDQVTPISHSATDTQTNAASTLTVTSATGELAFTIVGVNFNGAPVTPDATWTTDYNFANVGGDLILVGQHIAGAASSVTRTDSLNASTTWLMIGASLKSADAGAAGTPFFMQLGAQRI